MQQLMFLLMKDVHDGRVVQLLAIVHRFKALQSHLNRLFTGHGLVDVPHQQLLIRNAAQCFDPIVNFPMQLSVFALQRLGVAL
ncbi:hypothetical protein [Alicyclobacillus hesperidum]|uniref:hypothetical protein n=1 Tax=Alicyclobacillus hesperidum TaxID=89784 RepID=UPI0024930E20|nr:hypothetical protein [Alicyclobacillus hesperidum]